jgi:hypothetical protein
MKDNTNISAKACLRKYFLSMFNKPTVLECFAGEQRKLYKKCYSGYDTVSLDIKDIPGVMKTNNLKYIASHDINHFNFFDLDAYGDPYTLMLNIFHRLGANNEKKCIIITDGLHRNLIYGKSPGILTTTMNNPKNIQIPCLNRHHEYLVKRFINKLCDKYNIVIDECKVYRDTSVSHMLYFGFVFRKCS